MKNNSKSLLAILCLLGVLAAQNALMAQDTQPLAAFDKIIVSPHIGLVLVQGDKESISIVNYGVDEDKVNVKVVGKTLRLYLDHAKIHTKYVKNRGEGWAKRVPMYSGTKLNVTVTFKTLKKLSIRGEESAHLEGPIVADRFKVKLYGESQVRMGELKSAVLKTSLYGRNRLTIDKGTIMKQKILSFGENRMNTEGVHGTVAKATSYGESEMRVHATKRARVSALGESHIEVLGGGRLSKRLVIGENTISRVGE